MTARPPKHVFVGTRRYRITHDQTVLNAEAVRIGARDGLLRTNPKLVAYLRGRTDGNA